MKISKQHIIKKILDMKESYCKTNMLCMKREKKDYILFWVDKLEKDNYITKEERKELLDGLE